MAAGPLARTARPRKKPKKKEGKEVIEVTEKGERVGTVCVAADCVAGTIPITTAAKTMAMVSMPLKGISVAAA